MADMTSLAPGAPTGRPRAGRRRRGRHLRAHRRLRAAAAPRRHPLRVGAAARRPRPHARRPRPRTAACASTAASSCTTTAPTRCCAGSSPSSACDPRHRDVHEHPLTRAAGTEYAGGRGVKGRVRPAAAASRPRFVRMLRSVHAVPRLATALPRQTTDDDTDHLRRVHPRRAVPRVVHPALRRAARRLRVVQRRRATRWTTPRATCSGSSTTTACSPSATRPQWRRSSAARAPTSTRLAERLPACAPATR